MNAKAPGLEATTKLVARALGISTSTLMHACRPAMPADLGRVVALRRQVLGELVSWDDEAYLRWRYFASATPATLWILDLDGKLIAMIGAEQVSVTSMAGEWVGHVMMDLMADPAYSGSGLGVWLNQHLFATASFTLAVGANENSIGLVRRLFAPLPSRESLVLPVAMGAFLRRHGIPRRLSQVLGPLVHAGWALRRRVMRPARARDVTLRRISGFDEAMLAPLRNDRPRGRVEISRNAAVLNWRLFANPRARFDVTGAFRDGVLVGYVASRHVDRDDGTRSTYVIDCPALDCERAGIVTLLLDTVIAAAARRRNASVHAVMLDPDCTRILHRIGFLRRGEANYLVAGLHTTDTNLLAAAAESQWCITDLCFDSDGQF